MSHVQTYSLWSYKGMTTKNKSDDNGILERKTKGDIKFKEYLGVISPKINALYSPLLKRLVDKSIVFHFN